MLLCPKCRSEEITSTHDVYSLLGTTPETDKDFFCDICNYFFDEDDAIHEAWYDINDLSEMKISQIADIIYEDWKNINPCALSHVKAMMSLNDIKDSYGLDDGESVLIYFLSNSRQWQGEVARKVKLHIKKILTEYKNGLL